MSENFDAAVLVTEAAINKYTQELYRISSVREAIFEKKKKIRFMGSVGWKAEGPPTVSLQPPTREEWGKAIKKDDGMARPPDNAFTLHFERVTVFMTDVGQTSTKFDVLCRAAATDRKIRLDPLGVVVDLSSASGTDQALFKKTIIPYVLKAAGAVLSHGPIPDVSFRGVDFDKGLGLRVGDRHISLAANMAGRGPASPLPVHRFPGGGKDFQLEISRRLRDAVLKKALDDLRGRKAKEDGSVDLGVGTGRYEATATIKQVSVNNINLPSITARGRAGVSAGASFEPDFWGPFSKGLHAIRNVAFSGARSVAGGISSAASSFGSAVGGLL